MSSSTATIDIIKSHLREYLIANGVVISGTQMSCPIPDCLHERGDQVPSCGFVPDTDESIIHCFKSGRTVDIFHLAHLWEHLPIDDSRFYTVTLPTLAEQFGIPYDEDELTPEEQEQYRVERAYRDATAVITAGASRIETTITARGWSLQTARQYGIGAIASVQEYLSQMVQRGWSVDYLDSVGLTKSDLFDPARLLFTINDASGQPVGFVGRSPEADPKTKKYVNSGADDPLYRKREILYLFDHARTLDGPVWIVEGYPDAVTLLSHGRRAVGLGGTAFTPEHLSVLDEQGCRDVVFAFDGDQGGQAGVDRALNVVVTLPGFRTAIVELPEGQDPDAIVRDGGLVALDACPTISAFRYRLRQHFAGVTHEQVQEQLLPLIVSEVMPVLRDGMLKDLAAHSGIDVSVLRDGLDVLVNQDARLRQERQREILDRVQVQLRRSPGDGRRVLETAVRQFQELDTALKRPDPDTVYEETMRETMYRSAHRSTGLLGYHLPAYPALERLCDGFPKQRCLMTIGGLPSYGKSTLVRNLLLELARHNPDAQCLYMSIDDSTSYVLEAWVAALTGLNVRRIRKRDVLTPSERARWNEAWRTVHGLQNLRVWDSTQGASIADMVRHLEFYVHQYPDRHPIVFVDSFHALDGSVAADIRQQTVQNVKDLKRLSAEHDMPIILVGQVTKPQPTSQSRSQGRYQQDDPMWRRPQPRDLAESVQIWFESDLVWMVHADLQAQPNTWLRWTYTDAEGTHPMPYLEVYTWKNKVGGGEITTQWSDQAFFRLNRLTSSIVPVSVEELPLRPSSPDAKSSYHAATESAPWPKTTVAKEPAWSSGSGC